MLRPLIGLAACPPRTRSLSVGWMVVRLNEDTSYSREQIAAWLCVKGGCKHPLDEPMVIEPGRSSIVLCDCSVCRDLGFVPDLVA